MIWEECSGLFLFEVSLLRVVNIRSTCLSAEMTSMTVTACVNVQQQINRQIGPFEQIIHDQTFSFMRLTCVGAIRTRLTEANGG